MLVYTRKGSAVDCNRSALHKPTGDCSTAQSETPTPPPRVLDVINSLNAAHDEACEAYTEKSVIVFLIVFFFDSDALVQRKGG
jgi:hypothetical protein